MKKQLLLILLLIFSASVIYSQIKSSTSGNWDDAATWVGGIIPSANDDVIIDAGHIVTINTSSAVCKNLQVDGTLLFGDNDNQSITVNGSITIGATGVWNSMSGTLTATRISKITLYGDLTVINGGKFDMRKGVPNGYGGVTVIFEGSSDSYISLNKTSYSSSTEEFNSIIINKRNGAKVILKSGNLFMGDYTTDTPSILTFNSGSIETQGTNVWVQLANSDESITGANATNFVKGILGRGFDATGSASRTFYIGDDNNYRPLKLRVSTAIPSGGYLFAQSIKGNANVNSVLSGDIDKVSGVRYFMVSYKAPKNGPASVTIDSVGISYGNDDGVKTGNTNLRIAYSLDSMKTWNSLGPNNHTTNLLNIPNMITASTGGAVIVNDGKLVYLALARKTGTTENSLETETSVEKLDELPSTFNLSQNYPNPFNPITNITFEI
ncbi:MAG: G8 domain-containing protein, partial [Candidatus Anstonellales archaeon]